MYNTIKYGRHRIVGNVLGALFSLVVIFIFDLFGDGRLVQIIAVPTIVIILIWLLSIANCYEGTVGACATLLTILFMIPENESYVYALARVVDSFIGMGVAFAINFILPYHQNKLKNNLKE